MISLQEQNHNLRELCVFQNQLFVRVRIGVLNKENVLESLICRKEKERAVRGYDILAEDKGKLFQCEKKLILQYVLLFLVVMRQCQVHLQE